MKRFFSLAAVLLICQTPYQQYNEQIRRLQASFISNFPAYVSWPFHPKNQLFVGLIGSNPLSGAGRAYLRTHGYGGIQFVLEQADVQNLDRYQMLYIEGIDKKQVKAILKKIAKKPILTIGIEPDFLEMGGIVNFRIQGDAVNFFVSFANGEKAGLKINPYLAKYGQTL